MAESTAIFVRSNGIAWIGSRPPLPSFDANGPFSGPFCLLTLPGDIEFCDLPQQSRARSVRYRAEAVPSRGWLARPSSRPAASGASADLVATINQHVGDLLRAYVAEAIEREIETWTRDSAPPGSGRDRR